MLQTKPSFSTTGQIIFSVSVQSLADYKEIQQSTLIDASGILNTYAGCLDSCQRAVVFWCLSPWSFLVLFSMATINSHEASPSTTSRWSYHVFVSFRGEDTRRSFVARLYNALFSVGLRTFRDDYELERREHILSRLQKAIEGSRVSIIVLSKNYASSRWRLEELVMILKRRASGHLVIPVFYDVDPSEVGEQIGSFKEAFMRHERRIETEMGEQKEYLKGKVQEWRMALKEVANLAGFQFSPNIFEA
ncbi:hypothetical protein RHMOL_Rhmol05G0091400 [Rhododendron molle]|uniref:Uncharacterized protein n=1 Tax=Rhododendron molle TaxID=49168 RepID=A0ACC0NLT1_RHOML|nr:hypothetical protein RHMOL_Rhmol05G0091400 [Rhododendron molle]